MGPTACGKTALAMALHQVIPVDIISVDSAMVYRDMNIGTAKPTAAELAKVPHALVDIRDPADSYNVADFCDDAQQTIAESIAKSMARAGAIKKGKYLTKIEMRELIDQLFACSNPYASPFGKKCFLTFELEELERKFS